MNDFISLEEVHEFLVLGPLPPGVSPLDNMDQYRQGVAQVDIGAEPGEYYKMMERFQKTFRPDAKAPAGGEVLFSITNSEK